MLVTHTYDDPQLNLTLELFVREVREVLGDRLRSVIVQGSVVFDDLAPGYSDVDFVAVVADDDLSDELRECLVALRRPFRAGSLGVLAWALEGPFLPRRMLDPTATGSALCWGTGGERRWERNGLGALVHRVIRERGHVIYGEDLRAEFPLLGWAAEAAEVRRFCESAARHGGGGTLKSVDWLLSTARMMLWLREDRLSSKSEAAEWAMSEATGEWRLLLPQARDLRRHPALAAEPEWQQWLATLKEPTCQAAEELLAALQVAHPTP